MTIQDDIAHVRRLGMSRKHLATLSDLTESVIWRIEKKGTIHDAERVKLGPVLDRIFNRHGGASGPGDGGDVASPGPGAGADGLPGTPPPGPGLPAPAPEPTPTTGTTGPVATQLGTPPEANGTVTWQSLRAVAAGVSDHDLERGQYLGPDTSSGHRFISNSEVQTFKDCRRRWWLAYYRKLGLKVESPLG